jgi:hypothetical protein
MVVSGLSLGVGVDIPKSESMGFELRMGGPPSSAVSPADVHKGQQQQQQQHPHHALHNLNGPSNGSQQHVTSLSASGVSASMPRAPSSDDSICSDDGHHVGLSPQQGRQGNKFRYKFTIFLIILSIFLRKNPLSILHFSYKKNSYFE